MLLAKICAFCSIPTVMMLPSLRAFQPEIRECIKVLHGKQNFKALPSLIAVSFSFFNSLAALCGFLLFQSVTFDQVDCSMHENQISIISGRLVVEQNLPHVVHSFINIEITFSSRLLDAIHKRRSHLDVAHSKPTGACSNCIFNSSDACFPGHLRSIFPCKSNDWLAFRPTRLIHGNGLCCDRRMCEAVRTC